MHVVSNVKDLLEEMENNCNLLSQEVKVAVC